MLGFLKRSHHSYFHTVEDSVKSAEAISIFDAFTEAYDDEYQQTKVPCMVVLDNASMHRSQEFKDKIEYIGKDKAVYLHFLPVYSPELNWIERLWRKIKYVWLTLDAYQNYEYLKQSVLTILDSIGKKYAITFT